MSKLMKLIASPTECGYCDISPNFRADICRHPKTPLLKCLPDKFPDFCPLQDGEPSERYYGGVRGGANTPKDKPKRRNRKDCIHIEKHNGCSAPFKDTFHCEGVNCGHFEPKTK